MLTGDDLYYLGVYKLSDFNIFCLCSRFRALMKIGGYFAIPLLIC